MDSHHLHPPQSATERLNRQKALQLASRAKGVVKKFAKSWTATQQAEMKRPVDLSRRDVEWSVGDDVVVDTKNREFDRPS